MVKAISAALTTSIQSEVTTLATLVKIRRPDGRVINLTNHDTDLTFEAEVYQNDIRFVLSAISNSTGFTVDNAELDLRVDGTIFSLKEIRNGTYRNSTVTISLVDFENLSAGALVLREGIWGKTTINETNAVVVVIEGLLKVLDLEVGRIYQPTCDADFGDERCKIPVRLAQGYSTLTTYFAGDWVYRYDGSETAETLTNADFNLGADVNAPDPITGWTRGTDNPFEVLTTDGGLAAGEGVRALYGGTDASVGGVNETSITQDVASTSTTMSDVDIDAGKFYIQVLAYVGNHSNDTGLWRVAVEFLDTNGLTIGSLDTDYKKNDTLGVFEEVQLVGLVPVNTRTFRYRLAASKLSGNDFNVAFDNLRVNVWDQTTTDPTGGKIYKVMRVVDYASDEIVPSPNPTFTLDGAVANTNAQANITGWAFNTSDFWQITASNGILTPQSGGFFLYAGDDGSNTAQSYVISEDIAVDDLVDPNSVAIATGLATARVFVRVGFNDITSSANVNITWLDDVDATISGQTQIVTPALGWNTVQFDASVPVNAATARITLTATSPTGSSQPEVGFDTVLLWMYDSRQPSSIGAKGEGTTFNTTTGEITADGNLIWKAVTTKTLFDTVASVVDVEKEFTGTVIVGGDGAFETAEIEWVSGANRGKKNVIRKWTQGTKTIKLYFKTLENIQVGDRFRYQVPCQKRFEEDCKIVHDNVINFQGFPHLQGNGT